MAWDYDNGVWVSISEASIASLEKPKPKHARPRGANKKNCVWNYDTGKWIPESELDATTHASNVPVPMQDDPNVEYDVVLYPIVAVSTTATTTTTTTDDSSTAIENIQCLTEDVNANEISSDEVSGKELLDCSGIVEVNADDDPMGGF
jgi:hypothetical protein